MAPHVVIRTWHKRKDRSSIERWPEANLPAGWRSIGNNTSRQSWAIDVADQLVGRISLRAFIADDASARLGIYLRPDRYGQGIGTAALQLFVSKVAPVQAIVLDVATDNLRAIRCYEKVGFREFRRQDGIIEMMILTPLAPPLRIEPATVEAICIPS